MFYEFVYIARPELSKEQVDSINTELSELIKSNDGKVVNIEYWGVKNFAYRIKKKNKGHYCLMNLEGNKKSIEALQENLKYKEVVIRYLIVKVPTIVKGPSIMMQNQQEKIPTITK